MATENWAVKYAIETAAQQIDIIVQLAEQHNETREQILERLKTFVKNYETYAASIK